jgi:hypothetical protein
MEVVDEYRAQLSMLERVILTKSKVKTVRSRSYSYGQSHFLLTHVLFAVHILSGDLILHKRTLGPVKSLIYSLWQYDLDRTAACFDVPTSEHEKVAGYMSHKAKIYLVGPFLHGLLRLHLLS